MNDFAMLCWYGADRQIVGEEEDAIIFYALLDTDCGEFGDDDSAEDIFVESRLRQQPHGASVATYAQCGIASWIRWHDCTF